MVFKLCIYLLGHCPGFGQDRVNFHWTPGRGTAGRADPTWPNRAGYSIPCAAMLGSGGGELGGGNSLTARECGCQSGPGERLSGSCGLRCVFLVICIVVFPVPFVCCSVKLPLSWPTGFCLFLSILLCTVAWGGVVAWRFCYRPQPNQNSHCIKVLLRLYTESLLPFVPLHLITEVCIL